MTLLITSDAAAVVACDHPECDATVTHPHSSWRALTIAYTRGWEAVSHRRRHYCPEHAHLMEEQ